MCLDYEVGIGGTTGEGRFQGRDNFAEKYKDKRSTPTGIQKLPWWNAGIYLNGITILWTEIYNRRVRKSLPI